MIVLDDLDKKALDHFRGFVVKKDLVGIIKGGANVPAFVLEYLLANTCSTEDEEKLKEEIANEPGNISPKWRCSLCAIDGKECSKFCDEYGRTDNKRIYFKKMNGLKTLLYKKQKSDERK